MLKSYIIEFLGALFFIFVILATNQAIPIGLALMLAIMVGGNISGGHFNPAVTLTYFAQGKTPGKDVKQGKSTLLELIGEKQVTDFCRNEINNFTKKYKKKLNQNQILIKLLEFGVKRIL